MPEPLLRLAVYGLLALAVAAAGFVAGQRSVYSQWLEERAEQARQAVAVVTKQGRVTERVVTEYRDRVIEQAGIRETIDREVVKYVEQTGTAGPGACGLDNRWVRLHDAAAAGSLPPAAGGTDAAPSGLTAAAALPGITGNYGTCRETADRLTALQAWVRGQFEVTNGEALTWPTGPGPPELPELPRIAR